MNGPLHTFFTEDHNRLDALFDRATEKPESVQMDLYEDFRRGLLTHIKMEEKVFFPAAQHANGGEPVPLAARLRLDHAALTSLMVVTPTPDVINVIRHILEVHDRLEEEPGGMYDLCEKLTASETNALIEMLKAVTPVPLNKINTAPYAMEAAKRTLQRAGYDFEALAATYR